MKILMLLANPFKPDDRVNNEAMALIKAGHEVKILAWDREVNYPKREVQNGIKLERFRLKGSYNNKAIIFPMMIFEIWLFFKVLFAKTDYVHCHDFDTFVPGVLAGRLRGKPVIYDAHEDYGGAAEAFLPMWAVKIIHWMEDTAIKRVKGFVTPHPILIEKYKDVVKNKALVMNCKSLGRNYNDQVKEIAELKKKLGLEGKFVLMFTGAYTRYRFVVETAKSLKEKPIANVCMLIIGWSIDETEEEMKKLIDNKIIFQYPGVSLKELPLYVQVGDIFHCYQDPINPNYKIAIPNKLFDAMTGEKPVIVAKEQACEPIVTESKCGFVLKYGDIEALRKKLEWAVSNPKELKEMGKRGRQAVEKEYNWEEMARRIVGLYKDLDDAKTSK